MGNVFGVLRGESLGPSERRARIRESWRDGPGEERSGKTWGRSRAQVN